ncbi:MAG: reverse transcriptase-like protein [Armatimonadetes bacterium]|nr:reverse transcriptase-like protein [Armatimonadota bacterium]
MKRTRRAKAFSYVLVSAAQLEAQNAAGIGVIFKDDNRRTVTKISQALRDSDVVTATYEALRIVLEEALRLGVHSFTAYVDNPMVIAQLEENAQVPPELLGAHLQVRALMKAVGRVRVRMARAGRGFSARALARGATPAPRPNVKNYAPLQLKLLGDTAPA